ncbi:MAG: hypothetical protein V2J26_02030 [Pacificimonas sp.]|nr:hypothetical protein [Pacificimonas sp.]
MNLNLEAERIQGIEPRGHIGMLKASSSVSHEDVLAGQHIACAGRVRREGDCTVSEDLGGGHVMAHAKGLAAHDIGEGVVGVQVDRHFRMGECAVQRRQKVRIAAIENAGHLRARNAGVGPGKIRRARNGASKKQSRRAIIRMDTPGEFGHSKVIEGPCVMIGRIVPVQPPSGMLLYIAR